MPDGKESAKQYDEFGGSTDNVLVPSLSAEFWREGTTIKGSLLSFREVTFTDRVTNQKRSGMAYRIQLETPVTIKDEEADIVEMPPLTGFVAAIKDVKQKHPGYSPKVGDIWIINCNGIREATRPDYSNSPNFELKIRRAKS